MRGASWNFVLRSAVLRSVSTSFTRTSLLLILSLIHRSWIRRCLTLPAPIRLLLPIAGRALGEGTLEVSGTAADVGVRDAVAGARVDHRTVR